MLALMYTGGRKATIGLLKLCFDDTERFVIMREWQRMKAENVKIITDSLAEWIKELRFVNKNKDQTSASAMKPINVKDSYRCIIWLLNINSVRSHIRMRDG